MSVLLLPLFIFIDQNIQEKKILYILHYYHKINSLLYK